MKVLTLCGEEKDEEPYFVLLNNLISEIGDSAASDETAIRIALDTFLPDTFYQEFPDLVEKLGTTIKDLGTDESELFLVCRKSALFGAYLQSEEVVQDDEMDTLIWNWKRLLSATDALQYSFVLDNILYSITVMGVDVRTGYYADFRSIRPSVLPSYLLAKEILLNREEQE